MAARLLNVPMIAATSIPANAGELANLLITPETCATQMVRSRSIAPHGTGDYFAGVLMAHLLAGESHRDALSTATRRTEAAIAASYDSAHLAVAGS